MSKHQFLYGYHAIHALLNLQPECISNLYVQDGRQDQRVETVVTLAKAAKISVQIAKRIKLDAMVGEGNHQGIVAECSSLPQYQEADIDALIEQQQPTLFLILDGIQDPHNLGACMRSADAMGVHAIIAPKDRSVNITPTVTKVACGASITVPFIQVTNLARTLRHMQELGVWVVGFAGEVETVLSEVDLTGNIAVVMGAEGEGMRRLTQETCDYVAKIPMLGTVESLNVSVATGIALYEVQRQRRK